MLAVDIIKASTKTASVTHPPRLSGRGDIERPPTDVCVHSMTSKLGDLGGGGGSSPSRGQKAPSLVSTCCVKKEKRQGNQQAHNGGQGHSGGDALLTDEYEKNK